MTEFDYFSGPGQIARVRHVEHQRVYFRLLNGQFGYADTPQPLDLEPDQVIFLNENIIEPAPDQVWSEDQWVSIVRIKTPEYTVIEFAGHAKVVPTSDVPYDVGNTVEVASTGVVRVLDDDPLRILELPTIDDGVISSLIVREPATTFTFDDFGGLPQVVERARKLIEAPLRHQEQLKKIGARSVRGVLFTGQPGTGKTLLARIIAHESQATFYLVSGPQVVSKWLGQSEELLRLLFTHAESQPSAIIFFDEIDSIAAQRDDNAHEASKRLVAQLLTLLDGFSSAGNVMVIAATNRPQDIDEALRRPGRFDWEINFPLPSRDDREQILRVHARKLRTSGILPHAAIADKTNSWSGSHLAAIWTEAALLAAMDGRDVIMEEDYFGGFQAISELRQSVSLSVTASKDATR